MRGFAFVGGVEGFGEEVFAREQFVEQQTGAAAQGAPRKARAVVGGVLQGVQAERIARRHDEPLGATHEADDLVQPRAQQGFVGALRERALLGVAHGVEARHGAAPFIERAQGVEAAGEADVQMEAFVIEPGLGVFAQARQRVVMAGVKTQHVGVFIKGDGEGAFDVGAQPFDLGQESRLRLAFGPQQLGAEFGEARGLTAFPHDEFVLERALPAFELAPDVPVRQSELAGGSRNRTVVLNSVEQVDEGVADERLAGAVYEAVTELNPMHFCSYCGNEVLFIEYGNPA